VVFSRKFKNDIACKAINLFVILEGLYEANWANNDEPKIIKDLELE